MYRSDKDKDLDKDSDKEPQLIAAHPALLRTLLSNPTRESLSTIIEYQLFDQSSPPLVDDILRLLPHWEQQALEGNEVLASLIQYISKKAIRYMENKKMILANLLRIRILASTPGIISFPTLEIQEHLVHFLQTADLLADLPELKVVSFSENEIKPLFSDLTRFKLTPHSRRYIQNLFYPERQEAILSVLAYIAKNYPLIATCHKAYALMLSLDNPDIWGNHPFIVRLIANRFWDSKLSKTLEEA